MNLSTASEANKSFSAKDLREPGRDEPMHQQRNIKAYTTAGRDQDFVIVPLRQKIKEALLRRILGGHYDPGERLVELRIAEEFGTSQGPVREGLRDLGATGLVT